MTRHLLSDLPSHLLLECRLPWLVEQRVRDQAVDEDVVPELSLAILAALRQHAGRRLIGAGVLWQPVSDRNLD